MDFFVNKKQQIYFLIIFFRRSFYPANLFAKGFVLLHAEKDSREKDAMPLLRAAAFKQGQRGWPRIASSLSLSSGTEKDVKLFAPQSRK